MTTFALDSSAVLAWILQERGRWKLVGDALILAVTERLGVQILTKDRYWTQFAANGHTRVDIVQI